MKNYAHLFVLCYGPEIINLTLIIYFNDKKYSGPIVLDDYVEKGSVLKS